MEKVLPKIGFMIFAILLFSLMVPLTAGAVSYPFSDDMEGGTANWTADSPWSQTTNDAHTPITSWVDSFASYYADNADTSLTLATPIDLTAGTNPQLQFRARYELEEFFDFVDVEISTNGGGNWTTLIEFTGFETQWKRFQIDLTPYAASSNVLIRFHLVSDDFVVADGIYLDDVVIGNRPSAVTLSPPANATVNSLDLAWTQNLDPDFDHYEVVRSLRPVVDQDSLVVTNISNPTVTSFTDDTLASKTNYYYRIYTVNNLGIFSASNEETGLTLLGLPYPFADLFEAGLGNWVAMPPWSLDNSDSYSPTNSVTDSPGGNYGNDINVTLTSSTAFNFTTAVDPQLTFMHKLWVDVNDYALVEASANGASWDIVGQWTNTTIAAWTREQVDLGAYAGEPIVYVRFRLATDSAGVRDGWRLDDAAIDERPNDVTLSPLSAGPSYVDLAWTGNIDANFLRYEIYRSETAGVDRNDTLVGTITNQGTTSFRDNSAIPNTTFYYKVFVMSQHYALADGSNEQSVTTDRAGYPFAEDFESGIYYFAREGSWAISTDDNHTPAGSACLTDSPGTDYAPGSDTSIYLGIDLSAAAKPVLSYWEKYAVDAGDWMRVEVSTDQGLSWELIGVNSGVQSTWAERWVDLTPYIANTDFRIRFRLVADGSGSNDGWYLDDFNISEATASLSYPFDDDMETPDNWLGTFFNTTQYSHSPLHAWHDSPWGITYDYQKSYLTLANTLDLTGSANPQLIYWYRMDYSWNHYLYVQISTDGGANYSTLQTLDLNSNTGGGWAYKQIDLTPYQTQVVRIRFYMYLDYTYDADGVWLDDVSVQDRPAEVTMNAPTGITSSSMDLSWSASPALDFQRYEIYRSSSPGVDRNDTLVAQILNGASVSSTDTGLNLGTAYYYAMYVVDSYGAYSLVSNEVGASTTNLAYPFASDMDSALNWVLSGTWGVGTHDGHTCFHDSPGGNYPDNANTSFQTAIDLSLAEKPALTFEHFYDLETDNDWGRVEVSTNNGASWFALYAITGHASIWETVNIDLTTYAGNANLLIRFRLYSNGSTNFDGWYVDSVSIQETWASTAYPLPFVDDFEGGLGQWVPSAWFQTLAEARSGIYSMHDSSSQIPNGNGINVGTSLVSAHVLDLTTSLHPQLVFYRKLQFSWNQYLQVQVSPDGGNFYTQLASLDLNSNSSDWVRSQYDLSAWAGSTIRVRLVLYSNYSYIGDGAYIDDLSVQERPDAITLNALTPGQTTMGLSWSASAEPDFQAYHIYRSTSPGVDLNDTLVTSIADSATVNYTDAGLSTGTQYYYAMYVEDTYGAYSLVSNEVTASTLGIAYPFSDNMNADTGLWTPGGNWAIEVFDGHTGWTDSPGTFYPDSYDASLQASFDLSGASKPVLRFTQRHDFELNYDWAYVEVSIDNGANWTRVWGVTGSDSGWQQEAVDLTPWIGYSRVLIRFRVTSNGCCTRGEGLHIDDVFVEETGVAPLAYPFYEDFEAGLADWIPGGWDLATMDWRSPVYSMDDGPGYIVVPYVRDGLVTGNVIDLAGASHPQLVAHAKCDFSWNQTLRFQVSVNGGLTYNNLGYIDINNDDPANWLEMRYDLTTYAGDTIRLRLYMENTYSYSANGCLLDDISIAERPTDVVLNPPFNVAETSMDLSWTESLAPAFNRYEVRGGTAPGITISSTLYATISDSATVSTSIGELISNRMWYFKVFVIDDYGSVSAGSNEVSAKTLTNAYPFSDGFELPAVSQGIWEIYGNWDAVGELPYSGSYSLSDSPGGNYPSDYNQAAVLALDLQAAVAPVLEYDESFDREPNYDFGYVQVSTNNGSSWTTLEAVSGNSGGWRHRILDLTFAGGVSDFKLRFLSTSNGCCTQGDGWHIDNVAVRESPLSAAYPFRDDLETDTGRWANAFDWKYGDAYSGSRSLIDNSIAQPDPYGHPALTTGLPLDLSGAAHPTITFYNKRALSWNQYARVQVSVNGGRTWVTVFDRDLNSNVATWTKEQVNLSAYAGTPNFRLRLVLDNTYVYWSNGWDLDNIGFGEPEPDAPTLNSPPNASYVSVLQPTLTINNGLDYQWDPVTYTFEVYDSATLTNLITSVTTIPEGAGVTSWMVDLPLTENQTYWWRARGTDTSANNGAWMTVATFTINTNQAPSMPSVLGPENGAVVEDDNILWWTMSTDPDPLDIITYTLEMDDNSNFTSPEVSETGIPLELMIVGYFADIANLVSGTSYYWRVRADDDYGAHSSFTDGTNYLRYIRSPLVTSANPPTVSSGTGVAVTINGNYFQATPTAAVSGGGVTVTNVAYINDSSLTLTLNIAPAADGAKDVIITNPDGGQGAGVGILTVTGQADRDGDGLPDAWEDDPSHACMMGNTIDNAADYDSDTLDNDAEYAAGANPCLADTDADGLNDNVELQTSFTDPVTADTDGDGLTDGNEYNVALTDPLNPDTDGDGLSDGYEENTSLTDPNQSDSDNDGVSDGAEVNDGTDPNDPNQFIGDFSNLINYQGRLTDNASVAINGPVNMTFRLFDVLAGGTELWQENQVVPVADGIYNVLLGGNTVIPSSLCGANDLYLEIAVEGETMSPRQKAASTGFAMNADRIGGKRLEAGSRVLTIPVPAAQTTIHVAFDRTFAGPPRVILNHLDAPIGGETFAPVQILNITEEGFDVIFASQSGNTASGSAGFGYYALGE